MASRLRPCPICGKHAAASREENPVAPFCSKRCRLLDLSKWLGDEYALGSPITERNIPAPEVGLPLYEDE